MLSRQEEESDTMSESGPACLISYSAHFVRRAAGKQHWWEQGERSGWGRGAGGRKEARKGSRWIQKGTTVKIIEKEMGVDKET